MTRDELKKIFLEYWQSRDVDTGSDGSAVAIAILELADATDDVSSALYRLGTANAFTPQGALEIVAASLNRIADALESR